MNWLFQHPLFDPESESAAGSGDNANANQETQGSEGAGNEGQGEGQGEGAKAGEGEQGQTGSDDLSTVVERLGQIESSIAANSAVNAAMSKHGINDAASLDTQLALVARLNQNPAMKGIMDSLAGPEAATEEVKTGTEPSDLSKMSRSDLQTLMQQTIVQSLTQVQQAQNQQRFNDETSIESRLIGDILKDEAFKRIAGDHDFDALMTGKGSAAGNALAVLADQFMFQRGTKDVNGQTRPVTDPTVAAEVRKQLQEVMAELQAAAVLAASQDPNAIEGPDAPNLSDSNVVDDDPSQGDAYAPKDPDPKEIREYFRKTEKATMAALENNSAAAMLM